ncbi:M48 family metallopeptidase [Nitrospira moscoviensis]|uniref:Putative Peptidase M48, Ste24p n=1 Tax=Nitrospira moscoviensis TaxID=42253 RepID=A0A0K2GAG0_NITMO|nr:M48 family metallopeptidase [Nitrospira moscoviensis]ALA57592.1 putative Peptidase M48, Ste24p [Nitrospira moscoviensis]
MVFRRSIGLLLWILALTGCVTNPYTGRWQLLMVPQSYEAQLGAQAYRDVLRDPQIRLSHDRDEVEPVKRAAARIIDAAKRSKYSEAAKEFQWDVSVIKNDRTQNAFALPGGKIAVYTGIFPMAGNESGLAAIMGHEVVHALARHGAERMSQGVLAQAGLIGASVAMQTQGFSPLTSQAAMSALGLGTQVGILLPYSRAHESEADYIGLLLAAEAGYDPREAVRVWERMKAASGGRQPPEFLSTHPGHDTRIARLTEHLPEALALYEQADKAPVAQLPSIGGPSPTASSMLP